MNLYWSKAFPGSYYLRNGPKGSDRTVVAQVRRHDDGYYVETVFLPGHESEHRNYSVPATCIKRVEDRLRAIDAAVTYQRENF